MARRELNGPQKLLVGGLIAIAVVLIALIIIGRTAGPRPAAAPAPASTPAAIAWRSIKSEAGADLPDIRVAIIPTGLSADDVDRQARAACAGRQFCKVIGWVDAAKAASAFR